MGHLWPNDLEGWIRKQCIALVCSVFCLTQGYKQCILVTNNYQIVYSHIIINVSTFSKLWKKQVWSQYPEYKLNCVDYTLQIIKRHIFMVLSHFENSLREENKHGFEQKQKKSILRLTEKLEVIKFLHCWLK